MISKGYFFNKTFSVTKFFTSYDGYYHVVSVFGLESIRITYALVFASTCWRIEKFISFVSKDDVNVVECHYLYKYITDVTEKAKGNYDVVKDLGQYFLMDLITMTKNFIIMLAPIFKAGLLTFKVQKLLLILRDKLLLAKDDSQKVDIKRFINYIEVRPMKFAVWRVVPLDWTLPIVLINLSVTYLIVMIQFTHKY
ncbi:unnamed protein product [Chilo suppressalis]|uniref:Gustatory receptor n=1 Tax=Chilo suppressalis TaxID=168631 RepID=A0ABN8B098_CHISP|nr:unnamed protein product [Chilo suppressalis]